MASLFSTTDVRKCIICICGTSTDHYELVKFEIPAVFYKIMIRHKYTLHVHF